MAVVIVVVSVLQQHRAECGNEATATAGDEGITQAESTERME
jgi:hypothetical protein